MHLHDLFDAVEIKTWDRLTWFKGADLRGDVLLVLDATCARYITNCWLKDMRTHIPRLTVMVNSGGQDKPVTAKKSPWKAGKEPTKTRLGGLD